MNQRSRSHSPSMAKRPKWHSRRTRRCSRFCARIWDSRERSTAASWVSAAPARCCWMERPCCRVWCWDSRAKVMRSGRSKRWHRAASSILCKRRSPTSALRNAAIARPRFCSPLKHSSNPIPNPRATRSKTRSRETFAAAPATSRSMRRWSWRRRACGAKKPSRNGKRCMAKHSVIGKALRKVDAVAKVTGATRFADDLAFPRMLYCKLLSSTEPHARIVSIDVTAAKQLDGVQAVLTGRDLPIPFGILPVSQDEHALCVERVRFIGDPVAAVAATTEETATAALDLIKVVYEPLKSFDSAEAAVADPEPQIHDYADSGNLHKLINLEFGDVEAAIGEADLVREDLFFFEGNTHLPMEQHSAVASWSPDGKLTLWTSTQTPHYVHRALAKVLELPAARIRVIATPNGGGFGGKSDPFSHEIAVAKLAMITGRPVKITLTREEVFYCHRGRHPTLMWVRTGV